MFRFLNNSQHLIQPQSFLQRSLTLGLDCVHQFRALPKESMTRSDDENEISSTTPISPASYISGGYSSGSSPTVPTPGDHNHDGSRRHSGEVDAYSASSVVERATFEDVGASPSGSAGNSHTPSGLSMPQGGNEATTNKEATCGQLEVLVPVAMTSKSDGHNQTHPTTISIEDRYGDSDQHPSIAISSEPDVAPAAMHLQGAHIGGNARFTNVKGHYVSNTVNNYGETNGLKELERFVSFEAQFDSSAQDPDRRCHPGTRKIVLKRLQDWFDNPNSTERISWLYGPAGAGKSAIAQTIARSYDRPKVAATFFFFRSDVNRNDGNRLFPTLAYQLAFSIPENRDRIAHSLSQRHDLPRADIETQFNQLIARPFQALSDDATVQLGPADIVDIINKYRQLAPVIIIDGVDECTDDNIQQRFLKLIGDAVKDNRFPLRFLIVSRPELHIEQTIRCFQSPILHIDLAGLDDANSDIQKYLGDRFSRIASEQGLDPTWPGQEIIDDIVDKSSGNFIFASLVIRFVGDPDSTAETQLAIVLNLTSPTTMSPFAPLDQLFLEILKRVPDQEFLKRYLVLLATRISISKIYGDLHQDDVVLMNVSEKELHAKLRRMRSILKLEARIDVHHKSFLDFLLEPCRSSQYYIGESGIRQYLKIVVDSIVRYLSTVIEHPNHPKSFHFTLGIRAIIKKYPPTITLPVSEWQRLMQPLVDLQDKLLQLPSFASTWDILSCDKCTVSHLLRELLHLGLHLEILQGKPNVISVGGAESVQNVQKHRGNKPSITTNTEENMNENDLDCVLLSLFTQLPETMENWSPDEVVINLMSAILRLDYTETAKRVCCISDAQKLIDLLVYLIDEKTALSRIHPDAKRKAILLALEIFTRVPILPPSLSLIGNYKPQPDLWMYGTTPIQIVSQTIFAGRILDCRYIVPVLGIKEGKYSFVLVSGSAHANGLPMKQWRQQLIPTFETVIQIMLGLAKAIQYLHSMGFVLYHQFGSDDVFLDSDLHPKICGLYSTSRFPFDKQCDEQLSPEGDIFSFGCIFYELCFRVDTWPNGPISYRRHLVEKRLSVPKIPDYAWQFIQHCCATEPKSRPTIEEVVKEMEHWY